MVINGLLPFVVFLRVSSAILWIFLTGIVQAQSFEVENTDRAIVSNETRTQSDRVVVTSLKGLISKNALEKLKQSIAQVRGDPIPAGLIILLDSQGGDGVAAMQIGRLLRAANAHIFVTGQCSSACIFVLAGGVVRVAPSYSVGIHRGRITLSDANAKVIQELDTNESATAKSALQAFERQAPLYLADMGMSSALFPLMQSHQMKGVYRLSASEIAKTGLVGFDKAYLRGRAGLYMKAPYQMDEDELEKRTMRVASRCSGFEKQRLEFVYCYKETLRDPFVN